jgi:cytochrome bd-type quinol oxidase subunit 2
MKYLFWSLAAFLLSAPQAFAACAAQGGTATTQGGSVTTPGRLPNPIKAQSFQDLADTFLDIASNIGGILAVFFIIYSGFLFVTAGANETKRSDAKKALLYAVIGTAILVGARGLSLIICSTVESLTP